MQSRIRKVITCPCGVVLRADADDELVQRAQQHASEAHGMQLSRDQALAMAHPE
jgi:predicted small metal-binding protein